ncbi:28120_t:CDS:1, partial [Gigaspora margarita]
NEEKTQHSNNQVHTPLQIKKFQTIYSQNIIKKNNDEEEINEELIVI